MATLNKHGEEIGRLEYLTYNAAVMADGKILRNNGEGWKLWRKIKHNCTPEEVFANRRKGIETTAHERPTFAEYKKALHSEFPLKTRLLAHTCIDSMPQDPDGVWSEINDILGHDVDFDTIRELCRLWQEAESEFKAWRAAHPKPDAIPTNATPATKPALRP